MTKADDGMELPLYASYFARSPEGLPDEQQLIADARDMMALLGRLRRAPIVDPFSGPAVLSGRAAGVFFHEIFGHRVEGHRQRNVNDAQTFAKSVDEPVLPPFLSVVFDPTLRKRGDTELMGYYQYDDEGVKAPPRHRRRQGRPEDVSARPRAGAHLRAVERPRPGGTGLCAGVAPVESVVESSRTVSNEALMNMLREEARKQGKPFGLFFDNIEGGFTTTNRGAANAFNVLPNVVYRVYTDARPTGAGPRRRPDRDAARRVSERFWRRATSRKCSTASAAPKAAACPCPRRLRRCWSAKSRSRRRPSRRRRCRFCRRRREQGSPDMRAIFPARRRRRACCWCVLVPAPRLRRRNRRSWPRCATS